MIRNLSLLMAWAISCAAPDMPFLAPRLLLLERIPLSAQRSRIAGTVSDLAANQEGFLSRRLPRPSRLEARSSLLFANQAGVGQALANDANGGMKEPQSIIQLAGVEPEGLFVQIAEQMEGFDADVGSLDGPLQETPEVVKTSEPSVTFCRTSGLRVLRRTLGTTYLDRELLFAALAFPDCASAQKGRLGGVAPGAGTPLGQRSFATKAKLWCAEDSYPTTSPSPPAARKARAGSPACGRAFPSPGRSTRARWCR
jgi:hypothetical protein